MRHTQCLLSRKAEEGEGLGSLSDPYFKLLLIHFGISTALLRRVEAPDQGDLGALVAEIGVEQHRAEPVCGGGRRRQAVEGFAERMRQLGARVPRPPALAGGSRARGPRAGG